MPPVPTIETCRIRFSAAVAWKRSLSRRSSTSRPTNGASSASARPPPPRSADDAQRAPRRDRRGLALERAARPAASNAIAPDAARNVDSPTRTVPGRRGGLEPGRRVHEVAGDHALVGGAEGHGRLAGQDAAARLDAGAERADGVDELERRADGALGVVLEGRRRAPDGHHRVADELLDRAAVARDDLRREVEVAAQRLADILAVALLGERREADEVREQDA